MRNYSIDTFRFVSIIFIVVLHTSTLAFSTTIAGELLNHSARFAVPYFFMIAGFLFYQKVDSNRQQSLSYLNQYVWRIIFVYVFWYTIYATWSLYTPENWDAIQKNGFSHEFSIWLKNFYHDFMKHKLSYLFAGGRAFHLWFLPSLCMAIVVLAISLRVNHFNIGFMVAIALFVVALGGGPYKPTPLGLPISFEPRNGPFFSTIFVFLGAAIAKYKIQKSMTFSALLAAFGLLMSIVEMYWLKNNFGMVIDSCNYVFSTTLFATGITLLALSNNNYGRRLGLSNLGKLTMGIYLTHVLVIWIIQSMSLWPKNDLFKLVICLFFSAILTKLLSLIPFIRKAVT
jgi:surface polysaccharide O-acyltransferase-like enzyme